MNLTKARLKDLGSTVARPTGCRSWEVCGQSFSCIWERCTELAGQYPKLSICEPFIQTDTSVFLPSRVSPFVLL